MKILFTGGGTGGHFYPIIAIAQSVIEQARANKIIMPELYYMATEVYNERALADAQLKFIRIPAGKVRRYFSLLNFTDAFKTAYGCLVALIRMAIIYPDVVFGKGGYVSFPALFAAFVLRIPVIIHESDSHPGRVNAWAGKFASKIAISYPDTARFFDQKKVAFTGNPIRAEITQPMSNGALEYLHLEPNIPVIFILGGSQGAQTINNVIIDALPELTQTYQVIHQTGKAKFAEMKIMSEVVLKGAQYAYRYHPVDYLNELSMRMAAGVASIVITRAGSTLFEIACWGVPAIVIPLPTSISHDQTSNALAYTHSGAGSLIEENNLTSHVLIAEINRIISNQQVSDLMRDRARAFARTDGAAIIARALLDTGLEHES